MHYPLGITQLDFRQCELYHYYNVNKHKGIPQAGSWSNLFEIRRVGIERLMYEYPWHLHFPIYKVLT